MRIAFFHPFFLDVGGAELNAIRQAGALRDLGCEVEFVTLVLDEPKWAAAFAGWRVHVVPKRHWTDPLYGWSRVAKMRSRGRRVAPFLASFDHVIAINHPSCTMLGRMTLPGKRTWYCNEPPRGLFPEETSPWGTAALARLGPVRPCLEVLAHQIRERESARRVHEALRREYLASIPLLDAYIFNSHYIKGATETIHGPMRGGVIFPFLDFPERKVFSRPLDRSALKVLVQTRLTPPKNVETILDGFLRFAKAHPGAELHLVGSGPSRDALEALAAAGGPQAHIQFHGFVSDEALAQLRERCDVYALLPLDEPFGLVFPEAAAQGLLLVGPDHGGPYEIMEEGRLGWPCDALSGQAVCDAFSAILDCTDAALAVRRQLADQSCRARFASGIQAPWMLDLLNDDPGKS